MGLVVDLFNEFVGRREFYCCATFPIVEYIPTNLCHLQASFLNTLIYTSLTSFLWWPSIIIYLPTDIICSSDGFRYLNKSSVNKSNILRSH